jgi:hypothetical protein
MRENWKVPVSEVFSKELGKGDGTWGRRKD